MKAKLNLILNANTILGNGRAVPGGEDIDICRTAGGYPLVRGTTIKGLLRQAVENVLTWRLDPDPENTLEALFGAEGRFREVSDRRVVFSPLNLIHPPTDPAACYATRVFTSIEDGVVKPRTLRTALTVRKGLEFTGILEFAAQDYNLLQEAVQAIRFIGTLRGKGFGAVTLHLEAIPEPACDPQTEKNILGNWIRYEVTTLAPLLLADPGSSDEHQTKSWRFIPGSAIRGYVLNTLSEDQSWFSPRKKDLLCDVRFLDALPTGQSKLPPLPPIQGFYTHKDGSGFRSVLTQKPEPGMKRSSLGTACAITDSSTIVGWRSKADTMVRIKRADSTREDSLPFTTEFLPEGQRFEGYIFVKNRELAGRILSTLNKGRAQLGSDRYEGHGAVSFNSESVERPRWSCYGYGEEKPDSELFMLTLTPMAMINDLGEHVGLDLDSLGEKLGGKVSLLGCATSVKAFSSYNTVLGSRDPSDVAYESGSVFHIHCHCDPAPALNRVLELESMGLGDRRPQGYGQVLFLRPSLFKGITAFQMEEESQSTAAKKQAEVQKARQLWVQKTIEEEGLQKERGYHPDTLSDSQLGAVQRLLERALLTKSLSECFEALAHKQEIRNMGVRYARVEKLIHRVLENPMPESLGLQSQTDRLRLLIELFDHSRKQRRIKGAL